MLHITVVTQGLATYSLQPRSRSNGSTGMRLQQKEASAVGRRGGSRCFHHGAMGETAHLWPKMGDSNPQPEKVASHDCNVICQMETRMEEQHSPYWKTRKRQHPPCYQPILCQTWFVNHTTTTSENDWFCFILQSSICIFFHTFWRNSCPLGSNAKERS